MTSRSRVATLALCLSYSQEAVITAAASACMSLDRRTRRNAPKSAWDWGSVGGREKTSHGSNPPKSDQADGGFFIPWRRWNPELQEVCSQSKYSYCQPRDLRFNGSLFSA